MRSYYPYTFFFLLLLLMPLRQAGAALPADRDLPLAIRREAIPSLPAVVETVRGDSEAVILTPTAEIEATEPRDSVIYRAACYIYVTENGLCTRRFTVHTPDRETLPYAKRAARFYALLWTMANQRFQGSVPRLRESVVDVWLSRSGTAGGEQWNSNLYIYDLLSERTGIEWARELAHEYGHYLLPGASGYTEPENWANGVLGERLFLKWFRDDLRDHRLSLTEIPFLTTENLTDYCEKQVVPLIEQMQDNAPDSHRLAGTDRAAMNAFTGVLLYTDETYGAGTIPELLNYLPRERKGRIRGVDFLTALMLWANDAADFSLTLPAGKEMRVYLPRGTFRLRPQTEKAEAFPVTLRSPDLAFTRTTDGYSVRVTKAGWIRLAATTKENRPVVRMHWKKEETAP